VRAFSEWAIEASIFAEEFFTIVLEKARRKGSCLWNTLTMDSVPEERNARIGDGPFARLFKKKGWLGAKLG